MRKLNPKSNLIEFSATEDMLNQEFIQKGLTEALMEGDETAFKEILRGYIVAIKKRDTVKKVGISERTLFRMTEKNANPTLSNIAKIMRIFSKKAA